MEFFLQTESAFFVAGLKSFAFSTISHFNVEDILRNTAAMQIEMGLYSGAQRFPVQCAVQAGAPPYRTPNHSWSIHGTEPVRLESWGHRLYTFHSICFFVTR